MMNPLVIMKKKDIRKVKWYEEISEYFDLPVDLLQQAVPRQRLIPEQESSELKNARNEIAKKFMSDFAYDLWGKIKNENPETISDQERSSSWKEYVFLCINSERRGFQRLFFYEQLIKNIVAPFFENKRKLKVLDFGCGSSIFTRMLAQDYPEKIKTISSDVCKYAVDFSVVRNRVHNPMAEGYVIEDVMSVPVFSEIDIILAYCVFEHLPNSTQQIMGLIDALAAGGILIENYSGHSTETPHKSDTFSAYRSRDENLDMLQEHLTLLYGVIPREQNGVYEKDVGERFWVKGNINEPVYSIIKSNLVRDNSLLVKMIRSFGRRLKFN